MIIAIDFDGTIVEHRYPDIGKPLPGAFDAIRFLQNENHKLILWTCRNNTDPASGGRRTLDEAVAYLAQNGIVFDAVNANAPGLGIDPAPKVYYDLLIDDRSLFANIDWEIILNYFRDRSNYAYNQQLLILCAETFGVSIEAMKSPIRQRDVSDARKAFFYLARKRNPLLSYRLIGNMVNRDHATVLFGVNSMADMICYNRSMDAIITRIEQSMKHTCHDRQVA